MLYTSASCSISVRARHYRGRCDGRACRFLSTSFGAFAARGGSTNNDVTLLSLGRLGRPPVGEHRNALRVFVQLHADNGLRNEFRIPMRDSHRCRGVGVGSFEEVGGLRVSGYDNRTPTKRKQDESGFSAGGSHCFQNDNNL